MNRTRATLLLLVASIASLGVTGCHRHRVAHGAYPVMAAAPAPVPMMAPPPYIIVVETRGAAASDAYYTQEDADQEAAAREAAEQAAAQEAAAREAARRQRLEQERAERARIAQERAERARQEQAERDARARAAARGRTTIIVLSPNGGPIQVDGRPVPAGGWFEVQ